MKAFLLVNNVSKKIAEKEAKENAKLYNAKITRKGN
jgi:hypothetical protein